MNGYECVVQYPWARLQEEGFPHRGSWQSAFFKNDFPITLELGCGKGEYTVELARRHPDRNFIGIDIKGARMWSGATKAVAEGLTNVAFLRTDIELLESFFAPGEVSEIWITFPDPQMQKRRKRLTSTRFLKLYSSIAAAGCRVRLKTDSPFLYAYTSRLLNANPTRVLADTSDLYDAVAAGNTPSAMTEAASVKTFYEQQWLSRGKSIKYLDFELPDAEALKEVEDADIERDNYHSFPRGIAQAMPEQLGRLNDLNNKERNKI